MAVAEHHGAQHDVLGELLRFQFHHQHGVLRAGDHEVEPALRHLVELRVQHVFVVDEAHPRRADRAHEGRPRQRQRRGGRHHRDDVGVVLEVVRQHSDDHLRLIAPAVGEQGPNRTIDQPGDQRLFLGRPALALEIAAGNAARGVVFFLVVDRERHEVDAFPRLLGSDHGREDGGFSISGEDGAVSLTSDLSGFENELTASPIEADTVDIEHCGLLSSVHGRRERHGQDGERLPARPRPRPPRQHPAILPWLPVSVVSFGRASRPAPVYPAATCRGTNTGEKRPLTKRGKRPRQRSCDEFEAPSIVAAIS